MQLPDDLLPTLAQYAPRAAAALIRATAKSWAANAGNETLWFNIALGTLETDPARLPEVQKAFMREDIRPEDMYSPGSADAALFKWPSMAKFIPAPIKVQASQAFALNDGRFIMVRDNRLSLYTSAGAEMWVDEGGDVLYGAFIVSEQQTLLAVHTQHDAEILRIGATMTMTGVSVEGEGGNKPKFTFCGETHAVLSVARTAGTRFSAYAMATSTKEATWQDQRKAVVVVGAVGGVMAQYTETDIVLYRLDGSPLRIMNDLGRLTLNVGAGLGRRFYVTHIATSVTLLEVDAATGATLGELPGPSPRTTGTRFFTWSGRLCAFITFDKRPISIIANMRTRQKMQSFISPHVPVTVSVAKGHIYYVDHTTDTLVRFKLA